MSSQSKTALHLDWCTYKAAYACKHWHYSQKNQPGKTVKIGVWEADSFRGAIVFSAGSGGACDGRKYGLRKTDEVTDEVAELARVAMRSHVTPVTRIVAIAVKMLRVTAPGIRLIVSYADPLHDHHGGIYQGGNWTYLGPTSPDTFYRTPSGVLLHSRSVSASGYKVRFGVRKRCLLYTSPSPRDS